MSLITIDQLLESVDLDFEPRWVTKNALGIVAIRSGEKQPKPESTQWISGAKNYKTLGQLKLAEFEGKDWTECIYEAPRKTTGKIVRLETNAGYMQLSSSSMNKNQTIADMIMEKINELVDAVNKINENYACIAALTDIRKRLDTLEKCVKNKRGE